MFRLSGKVKMLAAAALSVMAAAANASEFIPVTSSSSSVAEQLSQRLRAAGCYADTVRFTVSMPQLSDDVVYDVAISQDASRGDNLAPCAYLIDWTLHAPSEPVTGFSAYFSGHHYRFAGERLQEYHMEWDSVPFMPRKLGGLKSDGVQRNVQFANLLPAMLADNLLEMASDSAYTLTFRPDTVVNGCKVDALLSVMKVGGVTAVEGEYLFDPATGMPLRIHLENSPGTVSEQTVDAVYGAPSAAASVCPPTTEDELMALWPDAFSRYRSSNFRIENLPGTRLPAFSLPSITAERYTHHKGDAFKAPTIIALLDATLTFTPDAVAAIRSAVDQLPMDADVVWAFTDTNTDRIEQTGATPRQGETTLMSARGLARDCGASSLPVIIICREDGTVASVIVGFNNNLASDVIQKMLLL